MYKTNNKLTKNKQFDSGTTYSLYIHFYTFFTPLAFFLSASLQRNLYPNLMEILRR